MSLEEFSKEIQSLRYDYCDEIPNQILSSTTRLDSTKNESPKYKVRKSWFSSVSTMLFCGIRDGYLPQEYKKRELAFFRRIKETKFYSRNTTREDIDYANKLLDDIIESLK